MLPDERVATGIGIPPQHHTLPRWGWFLLVISVLLGCGVSEGVVFLFTRLYALVLPSNVEDLYPDVLELGLSVLVTILAARVGGTITAQLQWRILQPRMQNQGYWLRTTRMLWMVFILPTMALALIGGVSLVFLGAPWIGGMISGFVVGMGMGYGICLFQAQACMPGQGGLALWKWMTALTCGLVWAASLAVLLR